MTWSDVGVRAFLFGPLVEVPHPVVSRCCDFLVIERIEERPGDRYPLFVLVKEGVGTLEAIAEIAKVLKCGMVGFCGLKDRNALSIQYVTLSSCKRVPSVLRLRRGLLKRVGARGEMLSRGMNLSNEFFVGIEGEAASRLARALDGLGGKVSFPNFFGYQRFGVERPYTHEIGFQYLRKLAGMGEREFETTVRSKRGWWETAYSARGKLRKEIESVLTSAVQAYIFNQCLSELIASGAISREASLAGVLVGHDALGKAHPPWVSRTHAACAEQYLLTDFDWLADGLRAAEVRTRYRPLMSVARILAKKGLGQQKLTLGFSLPPGSYGTVFLRELVGDAGSFIAECQRCLF